MFHQSQYLLTDSARYLFIEASCTQKKSSLGTSEPAHASLAGPDLERQEVEVFEILRSSHFH